MRTIINGNSVPLKWFFVDAVTGTDFDFNHAEVKLTLYSCNYKKELGCSINGNVLETTLPSYLPVGVYSMECTYWIGLGAKRANVIIHEAFQVSRNTAVQPIVNELEFTSIATPIFTTKIATVEYVTEKRYKELDASESLGRRTIYVVKSESGAETIYLYNKELGGEAYLPDEEDITLAEKTEEVENEFGELVEQTSMVYKFKDRDTSKGKGYVILRTEKSLVEQMVQENTIYEVRYDFDLGGETLEVPANCVLRFNGGSFRNGIITGDKTMIQTSNVTIFGDSLNPNGSWDIPEVYPEWFGAHGIDKDNAPQIQSALDFSKYTSGRTTKITNNLSIASPIKLHSYTNLIGREDMWSYNNPTIIMTTESSALELVPSSDNSCRVVVKGLNFKGKNHSGYGIFTTAKTGNLDIAQSLFSGVYCYGFDKGLFLNTCQGSGFFFNVIQNCYFTDNNIGIHIKANNGSNYQPWANYNRIVGCSVSRNRVGAIWFDGYRTTESILIDHCDIESNSINCTSALYAEYGGCFAFKFPSIDCSLTVSNSYIENNIPIVDGSLPSDDLDTSAMFVGDCKLNAYNNFITGYRRLVLTTSAKINFHDNRWGSEYGNTAISALIKFNFRQWGMEFSDLRFHESINRAYSMNTTNLYEVVYPVDAAEYSTYFKVDVDCNQFGRFKYDGKQHWYTDRIYVSTNGTSYGTGLTKNDPINSLYTVLEHVYQNRINSNNGLTIQLLTDISYNDYGNNHIGLVDGMTIVGSTLTLLNEHGITCKSGNIRVYSNIKFGDSCMQSFAFLNHNVTMYLEGNTISGLSQDKSLTFNEGDYYYYPSAKGCGIYLRRVTLQGSYTNGQKIYWDSSKSSPEVYFAHNNCTYPDYVSFDTRKNT